MNSPPSLITTEALACIAAFYRIEADIRGRSTEERRVACQERNRLVIAHWSRGGSLI